MTKRYRFKQDIIRNLQGNDNDLVQQVQKPRLPFGYTETKVNGPTSAVDNHLATFDGITGTLIKDSEIAATTINTLTYAQTALAGDVALTLADTWYDGPAVTLAVGTWLLTGQVMFSTTVPGYYYQARLWNGTTTAVTNQLNTATGSIVAVSISQSCIVVVASGTPSWRMAGWSHTTGTKINATPYSNLCAIKIV